MKNNYVFNFCVPETDREVVIDFFVAVKDDLHLPDRKTVANLTDLVFAHGGVFGVYHENKMVGALGYFFGDPAHNFMNKEILFLYVAAILPDYRGTHMFSTGLSYFLRCMQTQPAPVTQIRLQAEATNPFTNKLYGRFATPLGPGKSLRGNDVITYGATLEEALAALAGRKRPLSSPYNAPPHAFVPSGPYNRSYSS